MLCGFGIVILTTQFLGADGRGHVGLLVASFNICMMVTQFVGGPSIIALSLKVSPATFLFPAYLLSTILGLLVAVCFYLLGICSYQDAIHIFFLSIALSWTAYHQFLMLGINKPVWANELQAIQYTLLLVIATCGFLFCQAEYGIYVIATYFAYFATLFWSAFRLKAILTNLSWKLDGQIISLLLKKGLNSQVSNLLQFINYRFSFYAIAYLLSKADVGIFSVSVALAESIWILGKSIAQVHIAEVASSCNSTIELQRTYTLTLRSLLLTLAGLIVLLALPSSLFQLVFGNGFAASHQLIWWLSPGILALSGQMVLSHYFSGKGIFKYNNWAALAGLFVTICLNLWLIPLLGLKGAALASSCSYLVSTLVLWVCFINYRNV